ncbi:hypothetical protein WICMUC_005632 [Wickerhamomyces mucosus]|uniref:PI31 proteasome regulator C-terminal domain-containing protein n=1 Tax=Wickerhamomyces mucosus TaxID=1378264 RepID=A0A9P8P676_9ASCO|nr:hypothetical protein WICMUC_005632 [Wickerhamomyces mucosus]
MSELNSRIHILGAVSTAIHLAFGISILNTKSDQFSFITELQSPSGNPFYVTVVNLNDDKFILTSGINHDYAGDSVVIEYSQQFTGLRLPSDRENLIHFLSKYQNELVGYLFQKFGLKDLVDVKSSEEFNEEFDLAMKNTESIIDALLQRVIFPNLQRTGVKSYKNSPIYAQIQRNLSSIPKKEKTDQASILKLSEPSIDSRSNIDRSSKPETRGTYSLNIERSTATTTSSKPLPESVPQFDDEYEVGPSPAAAKPRPLPSIGESDLDPLGKKYPEMKPYLDPILGKQHNGMILDKNHPLFSQGPDGPSGLKDHPRGSRYDSPFGEEINDDSIGMGLPGGSVKRGTGGRDPFGGQFGGNPFDRQGPGGGGFNGFPGGGSNGFSGGFI